VPSFTQRDSARLVAATMRTSTGRAVLAPTRRMDRDSIADFIADTVTLARLTAADPWSGLPEPALHPESFRELGLSDPDCGIIDADRALYEALQRGDYAAWRQRPLSAIEDSGQQEVLNWMCLIGAMNELARRPTETSYAQSYIFNSNKCFAVFEP